MKYRSTHDSLDVCFELGGVDYVVSPGSECEVPDFWHPWVLSRGLLLEVVVDKPATPDPEPVPEPEVVKPEPPKAQGRATRQSSK